MKKTLLFVGFLGLLFAIGHEVQATGVGLEVGVKSASMHEEYPLFQKEATLQTSAGFQLREEMFSTFLSGGVDLVGHISYDSEKESSQGIRVSNSVRRKFHGLGLEARNVLHLDEENIEGEVGIGNFSTSVSISRGVFPTVEGRVIGGGYYSHQNPLALLLGVGLSKEVLSCKVEVGLWMREDLALTGRVSKEMELHRVTLGTMIDSQESKVWVEMRMSINNLKDFQ